MNCITDLNNRSFVSLLTDYIDQINQLTQTYPNSFIYRINQTNSEINISMIECQLHLKNVSTLFDI